MSKKKKTIEILKGRELLRVNSLHKPISEKNRRARMSIATLFFFIVTVYFYWTNRSRLDLLLPLLGILIILYGAVLFMTSYWSGVLGQPLIITDKGIAGPHVAESWDEIESYRWENFNGATKIFGPTVFSTCDGVCLRIKNKGIFPRTLDGHGHTMFAQFLIFFSPEQIATAESILKQHGIKKA
jgi:hypothetical protein